MTHNVLQDVIRDCIFLKFENLQKTGNPGLHNSHI